MCLSLPQAGLPEEVMEDNKGGEERPKWNNKAEYLLTCIGFAVGVGNVWRFPYLCQIYGGGAFLIPYLIALVFQGLPLLYLELAIGQRLRMGSIGVWNSISPYLGGVGVASMVVSFSVCLFYNTIVAWVLWYLFNSFQEPLPWSQCPLNHNNTGMKRFEYIMAFGGLISFSSYNSQKNDCERDAVVVGVINSATSIYASIPIFAILGFKAHTNYVTCLNGNILELTNEFDISDMNITVENYQQWFDSLNGTHPSRVSNLNLKTCDMQTFLDQSASGTGLAFIVFTEAVISMPGSQVWAVLFFVMLFSLGLSSMFGNLEGVLTPLHDLKLVPKWMPNELFTGKTIICLVLFLVALIFCLGSGNYWLEIFNSYVGSIPFLIIAFFEIIAVVYIYGIGRFSDDLEFMTGRRPNIFWKVCWLVISPLMLFVVLVAYVAVQAQTHPTYPAWNPDYVSAAFPNLLLWDLQSWDPSPFFPQNSLDSSQN
uniref:Transporter n=1 Tax=Hucho hucho TaxID=62062 RepID=A0A4W5PX56_9TELE